MNSLDKSKKIRAIPCYLCAESSSKRMMRRILVTGATGQLGHAFQTRGRDYGDLKLTAANRHQLDVTDELQVNRYFDTHSFDVCINTAAYTAVDKAETDQAACRLANVDAVGFLAKACSKQGIPLIHFSSDYVYHGLQNTPLRETDPTLPKGIYARTKLEGELLAQKLHPQTMIIRTSWVYAANGHNFMNTMLRLGREHSELKVVFDQVGTPTYAPDLAGAVLEMLQKVWTGAVPATALQGVYHYSNEGVASWYDFALAIFEYSGINCKVIPIESTDYPTPAQRPPFSVLNKAKIKAAFGLEIPHWRSSLRKCMQGE
jgi:dTDP-4-dehydrorhamnose reductase